MKIMPIHSEEFNHFKNFIIKQKPCPFTKLSLDVDLSILGSKELEEIINELNKTQIAEMELILTEQDFNNARLQIRTNLSQLTKEISYPLQVRIRNANGSLSEYPDTYAFQATVIKNIQKRNIEPSKALDAVEQNSKHSHAASDPLRKKIKLKELINNRRIKDEHVAQYIPLEIQHVETVEQQIAQEHQEVVELQADLELHEIEEYNGQLLGFAEFSSPYYKDKVVKHTGDQHSTTFLYDLLNQELFANLPEAIKYISPDAAEKLATNLPFFVALNKENLPNGFVLKKTTPGEFVLDYDAHLENEKSNQFTPIESDVECEPIYNVRLREDGIADKWLLGNPNIATSLNDYFGFNKRNPDELIKQLTNIWIKYGDEGINSFLTALTDATQAQPNVLHFLLNTYLICFPQWEHFYKNQAFFAGLQRISLYDAEKLNCLKTFLINTGSSRHNLAMTIVAFEAFWNELNILCAEQKAVIAGINISSWGTPNGGNPVVYMERMLFILKNARNLAEQFRLLDDIYLDNYGAYYASRYEGFKTVSSQMQLQYDAVTQNKQQFNKNFKLYSSELANIVAMFTESNKYAEVLAACIRFIGLQTAGITVSSLLEQFNEFKRRYDKQYDLSDVLLASLFFVSHDRYVEEQSLQAIFISLERGKSWKVVINNTIALLEKLYRLDIKLNQVEGNIIFESVSGMNSYEFESLKLSKVESIEKLLTHLQQNKFATLKLFDFRSKWCNSKLPFLYALDTAEFLAKDDPCIAATYYDDLLLFSGMINSDWYDCYYHKRFATVKVATEEIRKDEIIMQNMRQVKRYLHSATAKEKPNNLYYAIQLIINSKKFFSFANFIAACAAIEKLPAFDNIKVEEILRNNKFIIGATVPEIFAKDNLDLKEIMISLIIQLEAARNEPQQNQEFDQSLRCIELSRLTLAELQELLQENWSKSGILLSSVASIYMKKILKTTKELTIKSAFGMPNASPLLTMMAEKIDNLPDFQQYNDFAEVNLLAESAKNIASLLSQILDNTVVNEHGFVLVLSSVDFSKLDYETLYAILYLLTAMPQRNYLPLLKTIFGNEAFITKKARVLELIDLLTMLNNNYFPSEYLDAFSELVVANSEDCKAIMLQMITIFDKDNKDPILELLLTDSRLTHKQITQILHLSESVQENRDKLSALLLHLMHKNKLNALLKAFDASKKDNKWKILEILSQGHAISRANHSNQNVVQFVELATILNDWSIEEIELLHAFYTNTPVSADCLFNALKNRDKSKDLEAFLLEFEKAPFGVRDLPQQFSSTEVERVINQTKDLLNNSIYTYQYRKQWMEAFLFVNEIGKDLPVYYNKSAKDLTNAEIKSYFADLKAKKIAGLEPFAARLLALGLMREAMYRTTGEFPYSTQIIALIEGIMHKGDFIANIDTGQGKSLIDVMKAALLYLDSDRVDITTSSLVDAKRDINNYGSFIKMLGIPYSEKPISSTSPVADFQKNGINFSTVAQLSLFFAKAKFTNTELDTPDTTTSLVVNESDYAILDDHVVYRFATQDNAGISHKQEWIYYAINEFVMRPEFMGNDKSTIDNDIDDLKFYLEAKAKELKKSAKVINKFSNSQYLSWLESALVVNYVLKENYDYVIPDEFEKKIINGIELRSKVVKILMKDGKVSHDSTFGNGIQQLLCAKLNQKLGVNDFVIEPQNKTIIATNNANLINNYRARKGFIWGSSGTVGSQIEIDEQHNKYGFEFSKSEPHQKKIVQFNSPIIEPNEVAQFNKLSTQLLAGVPDGNAIPSIIFCKDIDTAIRLFNQFAAQNTNRYRRVQLYTGLGKEEDVINNAGNSGVITITTSALGRNTDIRYDMVQGLNVWHTFVDSIRGRDQKSGRTGRQGSTGQVNFVFNAQELGGKSIEQIQKEIDNFAAVDRSITEELYNVLGYLFTKIDAQPEAQFVAGKAAFLRDKWSKFSTETQAKFRESRSENRYDYAAFMQKTLADFNETVNIALRTPIELNLEDLKKAILKKYDKKKAYVTYSKAVTRTDCTPPVAIAYNLLQFVKEEEHPEATKNKIKQHLSQLFAHANKLSFTQENANHLRYLVANPTTQEIIVEAHREFLNEYLQKHSQKLDFIRRWIGHESNLHKIASNQNYLLTFNALTHVPNQPLVTVDVMKQAVNTLLDEYLETSWFISRDRKAWAIALKSKIAQAEDMNAIMHYLSYEQINVAKQDIATNKSYYFKPLHFSGHSRYQSTVSKALNLTASFTLNGKTEIDSLINELAPLVVAVTDNVPVADVTVDELKNKLALTKKVDKNNASVLIETLENALSIKNRQLPSGMTGRQHLRV